MEAELDLQTQLRAAVWGVWSGCGAVVISGDWSLLTSAVTPLCLGSDPCMRGGTGSLLAVCPGAEPALVL